MAVALVTTFYGTMLANLVFNPLSKRLRTVGEVEYLHKELIIEELWPFKTVKTPGLSGKSSMRTCLTPSSRITALGNTQKAFNRRLELIYARLIRGERYEKAGSA